MKSKTKAGLVWLLALSLFISVTASTIALASRIEYYTAVADVESMIPLIPEHVTLEDLRVAAEAKAQKTAPAPLAYTAEELPAIRQPGHTAGRLAAVNVTYCAPVPPPFQFYVSDDNTIWGTNTQVDIFKTEYENGSHNITVASSNGDKVIAPGTENSYTFKLKNDFPTPVDYTVTVKAYFTPDDIEIPVVCRLSRYDGTWIAGDDTTWEKVTDFDGATDSARLTHTSYVTYTLDWQWPYEGNDAVDTALANLATTEDLTLTIEIITSAEANFGADPDDPIIPTPPGTEPDQPGVPVIPGEPIIVPEEPDVGEPLPPKTGDESHPVLWIALAAVSFILLMILILWKDKDEKTTYAEAKKREETD